MPQTIEFYWLCIKDAWRGTFALANAWYGLWGPLLLYFVFRMRGETLTLPDKLDSYALFFGLALLASTWAALFLVRLVVAPARLHQKLETEVKRLALIVDTMSESRTPPNDLCEFGKFEWRTERLDPGENYGGVQQYFQIWIPVTFRRNANAVTIRVTGFHPVIPMDRRPPSYSWKVAESKDFVERDTFDVLFATVAVDRQHNGYYGNNLTTDAYFIGGISRHLFEIEVFHEGQVECLKIYLESPSRQHFANPQEGPGKLAGLIIIQENVSVFDAEWIAESRGEISGLRKSFVAKPGGIGFGTIGSGALGE